MNPDDMQSLPCRIIVTVVVVGPRHNWPTTMTELKELEHGKHNVEGLYHPLANQSDSPEEAQDGHDAILESDVVYFTAFDTYVGPIMAEFCDDKVVQNIERADQKMISHWMNGPLTAAAAAAAAAAARSCRYWLSRDDSFRQARRRL